MRQSVTEYISGRLKLDKSIAFAIHLLRMTRLVPRRVHIFEGFALSLVFPQCEWLSRSA
jgi:hypothetical protein